MWSMKTNNIIGSILVAIWLIWGSNQIGNVLIAPFEPVPAAKASTGGAAAPSSKKEAKAVTPAVPLPVLLASASADKGKKVAKKCVSCHSFNKGGKNKIGPNLFSIMGRDRAAAAGYNYSAAIKKMGGKWGFADMDQFLTKPKNFMKGTKMAFNGLKSAKDRAAVMLYLRSFADAPLALPK